MEGDFSSSKDLVVGWRANRDFVLTRRNELLYLAVCPQPLYDLAVLVLETGLRIGEALSLDWPDVSLEPLPGARFGYLRIRSGKSKKARRNMPLTDRAASMLRARQNGTALVFPNDDGHPYLVTSIDHLHAKARKALKLPKDFVVHSLRHTMLTRLGESGVDAFTIMRIAGHSSVLISQRYVHPTPEGLERAFERLETLNATKFQEARTQAAAVGGEAAGLPAKVPTYKKLRSQGLLQVIEFKNTGP